MAGISKLMSMGLMSIFGGDEKEDGISGASIPLGVDNGGVDFNKLRTKPQASLLDAATMEPAKATKKSSPTNILGIGY